MGKQTKKLIITDEIYFRLLQETDRVSTIYLPTVTDDNNSTLMQAQDGTIYSAGRHRNLVSYLYPYLETDGVKTSKVDLTAISVDTRYVWERDAIGLQSIVPTAISVDTTFVNLNQIIPIDDAIIPSSIKLTDIEVEQTLFKSNYVVPIEDAITPNSIELTNIEVTQTFFRIPYTQSIEDTVKVASINLTAISVETVI